MTQIPAHIQFAKNLIAKAADTKATSLDLGFCGLTDLEKEVPELFKLVWLEELVLGNDYYDDKDWIGERNAHVRNKYRFFFPYFKNLQNLQTLVLADLALGDIVVERFKMISLPKLTSLNLSYNQIGDKGVESISRYRTLTRLDLGGNKISEKGAESISTLSQLTTLYLGRNQIGDIGANVLSKLNNLTILDLEGNQITNYGAAAIAKLSNLSTLQIKGNRIGDEGAFELANLSKLENLDISNNTVTERGAFTLVDNLKKINTLKITENPISTLPQENLNDINELKRQLIIEENTINHARKLALRCLKTKEKKLDLGYCGLTELEKEVPELLELTWLEELNLSNDYYDYRKEQWFFGRNKHIKNQFQDIPEAFKNLISLKKLKLEGLNLPLTAVQKLSQIELPELIELHLGFNNITDKGIKYLNKFYNLSSLDLSGNQITDEGADVINKFFPKLKILDLSDNKIGSDGANYLSRIRSIKKLYLGANDIDDLGLEFITNNLQLNTLHLYANKITDRGTKALLNQRRLTYLSLGENGLSDISAKHISEISSLTSLMLWISQIGNEGALHLSNLKKLKNISLFNNNIHVIRPLAFLPELKTIVINDNPIEDCPADIYETNDIKQIRAYFESRLDDSQNKLFNYNSPNNPLSSNTFKNITNQPLISNKEINTETLKAANDVIAKINEHEAKDNLGSIISSKPKSFSIGNVKLLGFENEIKLEENDRNRDVKLILLGNSNSGKTTLQKYLQTGEFNSTRNTTHGLNVIKWQPDPNRFPNLKDINVHIWDFGGQEYYHEAYRLFLSSNAVYVVVWTNESDQNGFVPIKLNDSDKSTRNLATFELQYWLDTIRYSKGPLESKSLLLLQTKTDLPNNQPKRLSQKIIDDYSITESFHISLKNGCDQSHPTEVHKLKYFEAELANLLRDTADKASYTSDWLTIRNEVIKIHSNEENIFEPHLDKIFKSLKLDKFTELTYRLVNLNINKNQEYTIPRWLERTGSVTYFADNIHLKDKIFLSPGHLTSKIYKKLNEDTLKKQGELSFKKTQEDTTLKEMLKHLALIFPHPHPDKNGIFIAPQYLPEKHAIEDLFRIASENAWKNSLWLKIPMFFYKKVLNHLVFHYAEEKNTSARYFWKHGILFIKNDLRVLIKGLYPEQSENNAKIIISIEDGKGKGGVKAILEREIFDIVKNSISEIQPINNQSVNSGNHNRDMLYKDKILERLYISIDNTFYVCYTDLITALNNKETSIEADRCPSKAMETPQLNKIIFLKLFSSILDFDKSITTKRVFLSYSHQNTHWLNRLRVHLAGLKHGKFIEDWTDQEILPGEKWDDRIKKQIEKADIFIMLLSADFTASRYIMEVELPAIQNRIKEIGGHMVYILTEPYDIGAIQSLSEKEIIPKDENEQLKAISMWSNHEQALEKVAKKIRELVNPNPQNNSTNDQITPTTSPS